MKIVLFSPAELTSSIGDSHYQSVCSGENITFACDVIGNGILIWAINDADTFAFSLANDPEIDIEMHSEYFQAKLTNLTRDMNHFILGNLSSELLVIASSNWIANMTTIRCDDGIAMKQEQPSFDLVLAGKIIVMCE